MLTRSTFAGLKKGFPLQMTGIAAQLSTSFETHVAMCSAVDVDVVSGRRFSFIAWKSSTL
jgi:hypothetical protein